MTLGKKIKQLRVKNNFSQPELAEKMGIEQSYLSKLENDKSIPSNDIFNSLLNAFNLSLAEFCTDMPQGEELDRLKQIPDIEQYYQQIEKHNQTTQRQFLYISSLLIVLAVSVFYIGKSKLIFPEIQYQYESQGVLFEGETEEMLTRWQRFLTQEQQGDAEYLDKKRLEMRERINETHISMFNYIGPSFTQQVEQGTRVYKHRKEKEVKRAVNGWLQVLGVFLFSSGIMGFILERRLYAVTR
ncbi:helix-turn-helix transcriptional regulator [Alteromonas sp. 5E99-2]|uniref:helix-turn-helix domain-containing protein n=1 Tax=Alteromonas sp. 5E99-2 TaxID=2817683 RepID=UPI001A9A04C7|nr:helix-turn-helix transcriptional regulator [Alteromonas sp. 5E99-2]MBO1254067.1 helix-turn-helix transcriptional regulator [Alteromonas sp. 5E99-2]